MTVCEADNRVSRKKRSGLRITFDDRKEIRNVMAEKKTNTKLIANNKKAYHDYFIEDTWEAGISLAGTEVKSLRMGKYVVGAVSDCTTYRIADNRAETIPAAVFICSDSQAFTCQGDPLLIDLLSRNDYKSRCK